ncbi:MAG: anhydro-N-acetylmuramic acid kinase [Hyphomicrobiaceae bacterium]
MGETMRAVGLMSGTSMDGIDLALLETDGEGVTRPVADHAVSYSSLERDTIAAALDAATGLTDRTARPPALARAEALVTEAHATAVRAFLKEQAIAASGIDLIGFHGQTVLHRPDIGLTIQLGDGQALADATGIDVVYDFRAADMAADGEGAPLAPVYHKALAQNVPGWPVAFLNLGGVGNVTWIGRNGTMLAFDTGPGNALIDDWVAANSNRIVDQDGAYASAGRPDEAALHDLLMHPYFAAQPPKSLDRNAFDSAPVKNLSLEDGAATLTAFTAEAVARARSFFSESPGVWVVCGGGRRNKAVMCALAERMDGLVAPADAFGLNGDMLEAQAFAYLAVRSVNSLPLSFPTTTGVAEPTTGGVLARVAS